MHLLMQSKEKSRRVALTSGEGFLEAFSVHVSQDVTRLPVEVSEGQLAEKLIPGKQTRGIINVAVFFAYNKQLASSLTVVLYLARRAVHTGCSRTLLWKGVSRISCHG